MKLRKTKSKTPFLGIMEVQTNQSKKAGVLLELHYIGLSSSFPDQRSCFPIFPAI